MQKAARDLAGEDGDTGGAPASAVKPARHAAASAASPAASSVKIVDPPDTQVGDWHIAMTAACAAGKVQHVTHYDINGDGLPDTVCWHIIRSKTYGDFAEIDTRVKTGDREQSAYILLPGKSDEQMGLCRADSVTVKQQLWSQEALDHFGWGPDHRIGLTVADGECDPVWLFWPKNAAGDEVDFVFERD